MIYSRNFDKTTPLRILGTVNDWKTALNRGQDFTAVMIDLSKAFNTVNHKLLIDNLAAYIIWEEAALLWFKDHLGNKKQVIVNGAES